MTLSAAARFAGFPLQTLEFLNKLAQNNDREWFQAHRADYEQHVIEPSLDFICAMEAPLAALSSRFLCIPKRTGGSLLRIYRDTRFARDKRPYKTNIGIHFRHDGFPDIHGPGLYFHVGLDECFVGGGIWRPEPRSLGLIRQRIVDKPKLWASARKVAAQLPGGEFFGESLKRVPSGYATDHPFADDLRRKDFVIARTFEPGLLHSTELLDFATETYGAMRPLMKFLCDSQGARF